MPKVFTTSSLLTFLLLVSGVLAGTAAWPRDGQSPHTPASHAVAGPDHATAADLAHWQTAQQTSPVTALYGVLEEITVDEDETSERKGLLKAPFTLPAMEMHPAKSLGLHLLRSVPEMLRCAFAPGALFILFRVFRI